MAPSPVAITAPKYPTHNTSVGEKYLPFDARGKKFLRMTCPNAIRIMSPSSVTSIQRRFVQPFIDKKIGFIDF